MTREHKLALILGFSVVLIVGVLVGDHFSKARTAKVGTEVANTTSDAIGVIKDEQPPVIVPVSNTGAGGQVAGPAAPLPPAEFLMGGPKGSTRTDMAGGDESRGSDGPGFVETSGNTGINADPLPPTLTRGNTAKTSGKNSTETTKTSSLPSSKGAEQKYPVQSGDSLYKIASKFYGDSSLWKKLGEYNKSIIKPDGSSMREGVTLRIPPKDVLMGKAALASNEGSPSKSVKSPETDLSTPVAAKTDNVKSPLPTSGTKTDRANKVEATKPEAKAAAKTYTVKAGDTLGQIASATLGSSKRWNEIAAANKSVIDDEDNLVVGTVLKIPAK